MGIEIHELASFLAQPNASALSGRRRAGHSSLLFGGPVIDRHQARRC